MVISQILCISDAGKAKMRLGFFQKLTASYSIHILSLFQPTVRDLKQSIHPQARFLNSFQKFGSQPQMPLSSSPSFWVIPKDRFETKSP